MTHNTREGIEWYKKYKEQFGWSDNYWLDDPQIEFFHQELQKAREEERERILLWIFENMLDDENDQYWDEDFETWKDLSWIASEITPDQSELDQPKPIEIPVKGTKIDCKEHGANQIVIKDGAGWCGECLKKSELDQPTV